MRLLAFVCFALLFSFRSVYANPMLASLEAEGKAVCHGVEYSEDSFVSNPKQTVKSLRTKLYKDIENPEVKAYYLEIDAKVEELVKTTYPNQAPTEKPEIEESRVVNSYSSILACSEDTTSNQLFCSAACGEGSATVSFQLDQNGKVIQLANYQISVDPNSSCSEDDISAATKWLQPSYTTQKATDGDDHFNLYKLPAQYCQI